MQIGDIVDFRFTLTAHLGSGGMGMTFRAKDADTGDTVVVKTLREDLIASMDSLSEDRLRKRFRREATLLGAISHPHIPTTFRVRPEGPWPYIAMQLIEGKSLGGYLTGNRQPGPAEVASLGLQALEALDATHGDQVLHRDLKPDNIMITNSGSVFLIDFGIALPLADGTTRYTNDWVGTIGYMAPERLNGGSESAASDMYSLGCIFYEMIAGRAPFVVDSRAESTEERTESLRRQHQAEEPRPLRELVSYVPADLDELVGGLLAKPQEQRPDSARIREVLERYRPAEGAPDPDPGYHPDLTLPFRDRQRVRAAHALPSLPSDDAMTFQAGAPSALIEPDDVARRIQAARDLRTAGDARAAASALESLLSETKRVYGKRHRQVQRIVEAMAESD